MTGGSVYAEGFKLFNRNWSSAAVNKTDQGWQHIYMCHRCDSTPSLTITTTRDVISDQPLTQEFEKAYKTVTVESDIIKGHRKFNAIRASDPISPESPEKITYLITRYFSMDTEHWHYVQALVEALSPIDSLMAEERWLDALAHAEIRAGKLVLHDDTSTAYVDIAHPQTSLVHEMVERFGAGKLLAGGAALSTTAVLIFGTRVTLGKMGVRGLCGNTLDSCKCTDYLVSIFGIPVIKFRW
ncbi:hypothetical protein [Sansalvadorimonas verongulae]|uniref:hypothetical protein n=1 Tax=Sansalvadorimonas verongulae TaxID=2172824 RepID=UPI0012BB9175|nr:hypothetical protein [Sansalvadorimonas verongulae]MTI13219.1 hypothetical protein [Sansalvadorimonas verongulae]